MGQRCRTAAIWVRHRWEEVLHHIPEPQRTLRGMRGEKDFCGWQVPRT